MRNERHVASYRYELPEDRIARTPAERRDGSRLLVLVDDTLQDRQFDDFPQLLRSGDVLVLNETRVIPARLYGIRPGGGRSEVLLLRPRDRDVFDYAARDWFALVRPGRCMPLGMRLDFGETGATIVEVLADGPRVLRFDDGADLRALLDRHGEIPLPPYVGAGNAERAARYQTVFARVPGSVAAPTASLHFTAEVLERIAARGVHVVRLVLDVGIGTFRPMSGATIDEHVMHAERYDIPEVTARAVSTAKREGRRVVAAGTTVLRALEGAAVAGDGTIRPGRGETNLFVTPGFRFRIVDALLTNFHLPQSTLLVLVTAFAGYDRVMAAYRHAVDGHYRFFSFGDAMFAERSGLESNGLSQ
ncbi:MAG: tRNA preQ1(34) S-adenosylmethionine ribosyltransferase-isomerase QueA [Candidatus Velthaea sp.]